METTTDVDVYWSKDGYISAISDKIEKFSTFVLIKEVFPNFETYLLFDDNLILGGNLNVHSLNLGNYLPPLIMIHEGESSLEDDFTAYIMFDAVNIHTTFSVDKF